MKTAKELKENAMTYLYPRVDVLSYHFTPDELQAFIAQLCKEQREIDENIALEEREKDFSDLRTVAFRIKNAPTPDL